MLQLTCHLPARAVGYPWRLIYSSDKHGFSLQTLYRFMAAVESPVLLLIKDSNDRVRSGVAPPHPHTPPPPLSRVPIPPLPSPVERCTLPTGVPGSRVAIGRARPFLVAPHTYSRAYIIFQLRFIPMMMMGGRVGFTGAFSSVRLLEVAPLVCRCSGRCCRRR